MTLVHESYNSVEKRRNKHVFKLPIRDERHCMKFVYAMAVFMPFRQSCKPIHRRHWLGMPMEIHHFIYYSVSRQQPPHVYLFRTSESCLVQALLQHEPQVLLAATNADGNTPLHMFCAAEPNCSSRVPFWKRCLSIIMHYIIAAAAAARNNLQQVPLHIYTQQPCTRTSVEICQALLQANPQASHLVDAAFQTPLHYAAQQKNVALVCFLVQQRQLEMWILEPSPVMEDPCDKHHCMYFCQQKPQLQHLPALQALVEAAPETIAMVDSQGTRLHCMHWYRIRDPVYKPFFIST